MLKPRRERQKLWPASLRRRCTFHLIDTYPHNLAFCYVAEQLPELGNCSSKPRLATVNAPRNDQRRGSVTNHMNH